MSVEGEYWSVLLGYAWMNVVCKQSDYYGAGNGSSTTKMGQTLGAGKIIYRLENSNESAI